MCCSSSRVCVRGSCPTVALSIFENQKPYWENSKVCFICEVFWYCTCRCRDGTFALLQGSLLIAFCRFSGFLFDEMLLVYGIMYIFPKGGKILHFVWNTILTLYLKSFLMWSGWTILFISTWRSRTEFVNIAFLQYF